MKAKLFKLKKSNRVAIHFPWDSTKAPKPWPNTHERVMIPYNQTELRNSKGKTHHIQVVNLSKLEEVREPRFAIVG